MNVVVFGSTGGTGKLIVAKAIDAGHTVTAFARTPAKIDLSHDQLNIHQGDALDAHSVEAALVGQDAAISAIGSNTLGKTSIRTDCMRNIIAGLKATEGRRLIAITALGAGESVDQLSFGTKLLVKVLLKNVMEDHTAEEKLIWDADLDSTVVRPTALTDKPERGNYRLDTSHGIRGGRIPRADVATFILKELETSAYQGQIVAIA